MQTLLNVREPYWYRQTSFKILIIKNIFHRRDRRGHRGKTTLRQKPEGKRQGKSAK